MWSRKNTKQTKNKKSSKVLGIVKEVHGRAWYMDKVKIFGKYQESSSWV